ncbi:MAG: DUF4956 domain-containing protein [Bdellovibrionota bacterium]
MNTDVLLNALLVTDSNSVGLIEITLALIIPFLLSFPATWIYQKSQLSNSYSTAFIHSFFLFSSLSSILTLLIGNNLARAFGLIGAFSIIRFRNALKSPIDAVYIFWALCIGMACGSGSYLAAIAITITIGSMSFFLKFSQYGVKKRIESIIRINIPESNEKNIVAKVENSLKKSTINYNRINIIFDSKIRQKTYVYQVETKNCEALDSIQSYLRSETGVESVQALNSTPAIFAV